MACDPNALSISASCFQCLDSKQLAMVEAYALAVIAGGARSFRVPDAGGEERPRPSDPGGRAAILTFHSGEDRRVKKAFQAGLREGTYAAIAGAVVRPSPGECRDNPRARPAKLRWAERSERIQF